MAASRGSGSSPSRAAQIGDRAVATTCPGRSAGSQRSTAAHAVHRHPPRAPQLPPQLRELAGTPDEPRGGIGRVAGSGVPRVRATDPSRGLQRVSRGRIERERSRQPLHGCGPRRLAHAALTKNGLYYSFNVADHLYPGRVVFVPRGALPR